jgi:phage-related protein
LRNGIFELKVRHTNKTTRSLYFYFVDKMIIFTNGFIKKTNKTPKQEIEKALRYKYLYMPEKK